MVQTWPRLRLYAFPPIVLLPGVLERVRRDGVRLLLIAPFWPGRVWFQDLISLLDGSPWEIPVRRDLLSQTEGMLFHPRPKLWKLWVWPLRGPVNVCNPCSPRERDAASQGHTSGIPTRAMLHSWKLAPAAHHVLLSILVMTSPAPDIWPSILTDYTYDSELDIANGIPPWRLDVSLAQST